ncbi:hypothetical protein GOZ89_16845 [Agrobacterium vitis]|uniref:Uncharacterized protein n=1 Tax=Agrobacterium vitis TaxID=373 RepID=A0A6A9UPV3_AGRVI|nr:hypothetical protein [Agrobacterium vitis]MCF1452035.1 hypothetical protein [Agrobacterium vitis]MCF1468941.1 hypothetical protein [Agrobacterium vitis]MUZ72993.1 hypothetical protein [Agrobacterium vitis]MVA36947.1 hypothetical protein [Agrobacterium vitis]MVA81093.1 hypothetical protein [Agrobacterium vitis]
MQNRAARWTAALVAAALTMAGPVMADQNKKPALDNWSQPLKGYKDLPGVKTQAEIDRQNLQPSYRCKTETVLMQGRGTRDFHFLGSGMPRTVYRCTTDEGITYTGSEQPRTGAWLPGINPRDVGE